MNTPHATCRLFDISHIGHYAQGRRSVTLLEAAKQCVDKVRMPRWKKDLYLHLTFTYPMQLNPVAYLCSARCKEVVLISEKMVMMEDWVPWQKIW